MKNIVPMYFKSKKLLIIITTIVFLREIYHYINLILYLQYVIHHSIELSFFSIFKEFAVEYFTFNVLF